MLLLCLLSPSDSSLALQASLDRPSHKQTEPSAESIENGWGKFVKFEGKVQEE